MTPSVRLFALALLFFPTVTVAFTVPRHEARLLTQSQRLMTSNDQTHDNNNNNNFASEFSAPSPPSSRRALFQQATTSLVTAAAVAVFSPAKSALAADTAAAETAVKRDLDSCLYTILRVKEATSQESRLIKSGKFKDVQRANVKLACKFILQNYRLQDTFIAASSFIPDNSKRIDAGNVGQTAIQALYTILEYFDASDVQNIKVGTSAMSGKEELVLKGLETTRRSIEEFLTYFPADKVEGQIAKIKQENELNKSEWDPALGDIVNLPSAI